MKTLTLALLLLAPIPCALTPVPEPDAVELTYSELMACGYSEAEIDLAYLEGDRTGYYGIIDAAAGEDGCP